MTAAPAVPSTDAAASSPAEVFRTVAHELRQPLSSIESIAYYLSLLPHKDAKVQEHLARIQELIEQADWILSNGLHLTAAVEPPPAVQWIDIEEIITESVSTRSDLRPHLGLELAGNLPPVRFDPSRARALIEGLLILFRQIATAAHPAIIRTRPSPEGGVLLEIASSAPGYRGESALGPGATLEIETATRIVEAYSGKLECQVDPTTGVHLRVSL